MKSQGKSKKRVLKMSREEKAVLYQPSILSCIFGYFLAGLIFLSSSLFASPQRTELMRSSHLFSQQNRYQPYIEIGGVKYFNQESKAAGIYDLFLPLYSFFSNQVATLFFSDLRIFDCSGSSFEGNAHFGYRVLLPETNGAKKQLYGVYTSFDRRRSDQKNIFNQITIGGEYWRDQWFIGGNLYTPIGKKKRVFSKEFPPEIEPIFWKEEQSIGRVIEYTGTLATTKTKRVVEKSLYGFDAEVGYAFTDQLTYYLGGYWFQDGFFKSAKEREAKTKWGPRVRLTYDYHPVGVKRIFGILDGVSVEAGIQHDKPRGTSGYVGFTLKVGLTNSGKTTSNLSGFERHMIELVRRDLDIVLNETKKSETVYQFQLVEERERNKTREELLEDFGLCSDATKQEVKKQYREHAKKYHPDKNKNAGASEKFIYYTQLYDLIQRNKPSSFSHSFVDHAVYQNTYHNHDSNPSLSLVSFTSAEFFLSFHSVCSITPGQGHSFHSTKKMFHHEKVIQKIFDVNDNLHFRFFSQVMMNENQPQKYGIDQMEYQYSNIDMERLLIYRLLEMKQQERDEKQRVIILLSPMSKKELLFLDQKYSFWKWLDKELRGIIGRTKVISGIQKIILLPLYLEEEGHWVGLFFKKEGDTALEVKYFDSSGPVFRFNNFNLLHFSINPSANNLWVDFPDDFLLQHLDNFPYRWLISLLGESYGSQVHFAHDIALRQEENSFGCGAFTVENLVRALNLTTGQMKFFDKISEKEIRGYHYKLLEQGKSQRIEDVVEESRKKGMYFVDLSRIFSLNKRGNVILIGGKRRETEEVDAGVLYYLKNNVEPQGGQEASIFRKNYNVVYQFINDHGYLLAPLSGATAGGIKGGIWGAVIGGVLGIIDESLIYFNYTDRYYLTWGAFGIVTGHVIKPSVVSDVIGATVGLLLPTGIPTEILSNHPELIAPVISAIAEGTKSGLSCMANGCMLGVMDEVFMYYDFTDKHYLTFCTLGVTIIDLLGWLHGMPMLVDSIGIVLGLVAANYEEEIVTNWRPLVVSQDLYNVYNKILPKRLLDAHIEKQALALFSSQFIVQSLALSLISYQQGLTYNFERLDATHSLAWGRFQSGFASFSVFIFPYVIGQTFSTLINDYFSSQLYFALEDELRSKWLFDETALRLSYDENTEVLIDNLKSDMFVVANSGSKLITKAVSASIDGIYGVGIIIASSPNILIYSTIYNQFCLFLSNYLAEQQRGYEEKIKEQESRIMSVIKHDNRNIRTITERDGIEYTKGKLQKAYDLLREYEMNKRLWEKAGDIWGTISEIIDFMFNYYLIGYKVNLGLLPFENRIKVHFASGQVSQLLSWSGKQAGEIIALYQSLDRVNILVKKISLGSEKLNTGGGKDKIRRIIREGDVLALQNLEVRVAGRILVAVDSLELEMGKTYAITGESGCGKSSLLSKIKGIKENGIGGKGYIYYPLINGRSPKVVMISQQDYFPLKSSLLEIILYPEEIPEDPVLFDALKKEINILFNEIGLKDFVRKGKRIGIKSERGKVVENNSALDLDHTADWYKVLSGGEKKKILIVSLILKKPDILILDEIFNGLDSRSIYLVQKMLKKYLPNTLILVVDHHAQDNNYDGFYSSNIHFSGGSIVVREIEINELPVHI